MWHNVLLSADEMNLNKVIFLYPFQNLWMMRLLNHQLPWTYFVYLFLKFRNLYVTNYDVRLLPSVNPQIYHKPLISYCKVAILYTNRDKICRTRTSNRKNALLKNIKFNRIPWNRESFWDNAMSNQKCAFWNLFFSSFQGCQTM